MEVPVWKVLTSTNAPAPRTGVGLTASTKPKQVSTTTCQTLFVLFYLHVWDLPLYMFTTWPFIFSPLMHQHHLSGVLWMIQHSAGDLAVHKWTEPNTAAAMQAFTWVAPLTTVSVRVSSNYVWLNWSLGGNSPFAAPAHREARSSTEQFPQVCALLSRPNSRCYRGFNAQKIPKYLNILLL